MYQSHFLHSKIGQGYIDGTGEREKEVSILLSANFYMSQNVQSLLLAYFFALTLAAIIFS
jgi:hypothetical protein